MLNIGDYNTYIVRITIFLAHGAFKRYSNGLVMNQGGQRVTNVSPNMFGKQQYTANIDIVAVECIEIIMVYSKIQFFEKITIKRSSNCEKSPD